MCAKFDFSPDCNHLILIFSKIWKLLDFGKIPKKIGQHLAKIKIQQNSDKIFKICKKSVKVSAIFNKKLRVENGAKECIV